MTVERLLGIGLVIAVGIAVVAGLWVLGPPAEERSRSLDARRVEDLRTLTWHVRHHHEQGGALPERLEDVVGLAPVWLQDPRSGEAYGYRRLDDETFELCATFERDAEQVRSPGMREVEPFRFHEAGVQCFVIPALEPWLAFKPGV